MRHRRRSIRLRVTAGAAIVAAVVLVPLAVLLSVELQQAAMRSAEQLARSDLRPYLVDLRHQPDETPDPPARGVLVLIVGPDGSVRRASMPPALVEAVRPVAGQGEIAASVGRFEVVAATEPTSQGTWRLWAARDVTASTALLTGARTTLLVGSALSVVAVAAGAWFVTGRAMRPVERIRRRAEELRADQGRGRLPVEGRDELGRLAETVNGLLDDLRAGIDRERALTADAAHELRTPVAVLLVQLEAVDARAARGVGDGDLHALGDSLRHLARLIDNLLVLARSDLPCAPVPRTAPADLVTEAMRAVDRARVIAPVGVAVDLATDGAVDVGGPVGVDPVDVTRILDNLLGNALQHGGPVTAVVVTLRAGDAALELQVDDDGVGVPTDFIPFAFDRFARAPTTRASGAEGSGLGLALVRRLARRAGGDAELTVRPGGGTRVTVRLPRPGSLPDARTPGAGPASFEHSKSSGRPAR